MLKSTKTLALTAVAAAALTACSSIDCPLNNRVYAKFKIAGMKGKLSDTITVSVMRLADDPEADTVVVNRHTGSDSLAVPMSYTRTEDTYYFDITDTLQQRTLDTVWVAKDNEPHFESVDCSPAYFHTITGVRYTRNAIDSIKINYNKVTYNDAKAHFIIHLKQRGN